MTLLLLFAFLSGVVTILAPCIWPLLPIVLASTATGGRGKPLGVTLGVLTSFTFFTLALSYVLKVIPFDPDLLRIVAAGLIIFFGVVLIIPRLSQILEAWVSRLTGRFASSGPDRTTGFGSGFVAGLSLGILWTPCAGPILATVAALAATQKVNASVVALTAVYVLGIGLPLFVFAWAGNLFLRRSRALSSHTGRIQQVFGVVIILAAVLIFSGYDKVLQARVLDVFPSYGNLLTGFENNRTVATGLASLKQVDADRKNIVISGSFNASDPAPRISGLSAWLNVDRPIQPETLRGKVVLVDFWTYSCINCIRTLPHVNHWYDTYKDLGFVVIGVHTPEFQFEKDPANVKEAIARLRIHYPVALDNNYVTWNAFRNNSWPAEYLIDSTGVIRRTHSGEGEYEKMEEAIRALLAVAGKSPARSTANLPDLTPQAEQSPETYFGSDRMEYLYPSIRIGAGEHHHLRMNPHPPLNRFSLGGTWTIQGEAALSGPGAKLTYHFTGNQLFAVLRPSGGAHVSIVRVYLDGRILPNSLSGADAKEGTVRVDSDRLYHIVNLRGERGEHVLRLDFSDVGTKLFTFTFG
jgi:cytochrome c biogenesis protein CcdA/thiol-disulfide isomerase/thioredoxin